MPALQRWSVQSCEEMCSGKTIPLLCCCWPFAFSLRRGVHSFSHCAFSGCFCSSESSTVVSASCLRMLFRHIWFRNPYLAPLFRLADKFDRGCPSSARPCLRVTVSAVRISLFWGHQGPQERIWLPNVMSRIVIFKCQPASRHFSLPSPVRIKLNNNANLLHGTVFVRVAGRSFWRRVTIPVGCQVILHRRFGAVGGAVPRAGRR